MKLKVLRNMSSNMKDNYDLAEHVNDRDMVKTDFQVGDPGMDENWHRLFRRAFFRTGNDPEANDINRVLVLVQ